MRIRAALLLCAALVVSQQVLAQEIEDNPLFPRPRARRIFIGPMVGFNDNFHSGGFLTLGGLVANQPDCGSFNSGTGNGILGGIAAEYWFKEGGPTSLQLRIYYEQKPGNFTSVSVPEPYFVPATGTTEYFDLNRQVTARYNLINLEVQYRYDIPGLPHFGVAIGPKFSLVSSTYYEQKQTLQPAPGYSGTFTFPDGTPTQEIVPGGPIPASANPSGFRLGLVAALQYELLEGPFLVTPRIWYDLAVTKVVSSWAVSTLAGSIEIKYGL